MTITQIRRRQPWLAHGVNRFITQGRNASLLEFGMYASVRDALPAPFRF